MSLIDFKLYTKNINDEFIKNNEYLLKEDVNSDELISVIKNYKCNNYEIIEEFNIQKINNNWKKSSSYIDKYDNLLYSHVKAKYLGSRRDLINLRVDKPPMIVINFDGQIVFENGRNRFANLRDLGVKFMPFIVYKEDLAEINNICV